jgi:hypothetical protein
MLLFGADVEGQGSTLALFVATATFEVIVKQQIKRLEEPGLKFCQLVYDELIRILGQLLSKIARSRLDPYADPVF